MAQRFDLIVCTGVLHHLADPAAGLRALRSVLKPDGVHLSDGVCAVRPDRNLHAPGVCRRLGVGTSEQEIEDLSAAVAALPPASPAADRTAPRRAMCATPRARGCAAEPSRPGVFGAPAVRFHRARRSDVRTLVLAGAVPARSAEPFAATPHAKRVAALPARERYAAMELWRGTMGAHSVVVSPKRRAGRRRVEVCFDDERWVGYVPFRLPYTVCVEERLPAGAAAVLLNRSHQHHDLVVPISRHEKRMFDAIDGHRTIAEIAACAGRDGAREDAKMLFEKLWAYDQVVFDTSRDAMRPAVFSVMESRISEVQYAVIWPSGHSRTTSRASYSSTKIRGHSRVGV